MNVFRRSIQNQCNLFKINNDNVLQYRNLTVKCYVSNFRRFLKMSAQDFNSLYEGNIDTYNGVTVDTLKEPCSVEKFPQKLKESLENWKVAKRRGIWFKISIQHSNLIPILAENGFDFHHAKSGYVMMYKWLPPTICGIPPFAHTNIAVGGLVVNDKSQILVVKENHFIRHFWKFPGGTVEPGEHLIDAAKREVKEETNISFEFSSIVAFMHADKGAFGCSDIYILVAGRALTEDIKKCDREIAKCMWVDIDEYMKMEDATPFNKRVLQNYLDYEKNKIKIDYVNDIHQASKRAYTMYSVNFLK